jgi:ketosteroid isomerase-like protein
MSQEDLERVRDAYEAFARGDLASALELHDPDIEIVERPERLDSRTYRGREGVLEAIENWVGQWDDFRMKIEDMIDAGDGRIVAVARHSGRGKLSGAMVEQHIVYVHTLRDGKAIRWEMFSTLDEAFAAIGLQRGDRPTQMPPPEGSAPAPHRGEDRDARHQKRDRGNVGDAGSSGL